MKRKFLKSSIFSFMVMLFAANTFAAQEGRILDREPKRFGDYEVSFSAFPSTFLTPEVAKAAKLKRGPKTGLVNIAVRNVKKSEAGKAVKATFEGSKSINIIGQQAGLKFKEINEGENAIYYLADFRYSHEEEIRFEISVKPEGSKRTHNFKFRQQFYEAGRK
ncbi:DUF4426 domain-containing protein [Endozoicomonas sp. OPT23]|uniref:DUF4426 domain-containing protein n=1 Tax=Endozoicomonas sp. OPT23 TaxID=2072845 RepID=UPI00129A3E22|nr:DUF4426 domain-containing protein [Endozoicomonas sp. OPT23]MRI31578.1 DUF4426 domain-containing protein [Endozoicomonas sp. OPT23]